MMLTSKSVTTVSTLLRGVRCFSSTSKDLASGTYEDFKERLDRFGEVSGNNKKRYNMFTPEDKAKNIYMTPSRKLLMKIPFFKDRSKKNMLYKLQIDQEYAASRIDRFGPDLASAHFIVSRGGAIRFKDHDKWVTEYGTVKCNLPLDYDSSYVLEAIELRDFLMLPEALDTIDNLKGLKYFDASNCLTMEDSSLDRIAAQFMDTLEYLDISHCSNIGPNGIITLAKARALRHLKVEGLNDIENFQLICLMLTEANPHLIIEGVIFDDEEDDLDDEELYIPDTDKEIITVDRQVKVENGVNESKKNTT